MTNAVYPKWKEAIQKGTANSSLAGSGVTGIYAALIDLADYTYNATDEFYSSVVAGEVGTPQEITGKTFTDGVLDGGNVTFSNVTGDELEAIVIYVKNAGANTTWRVYGYLDTGVTGLPVTPNGGDITITWNASGIIAL